MELALCGYAQLLVAHILKDLIRTTPVWQTGSWPVVSCEWLVIFVHDSVWLYLYFVLLHPFSFYKEKSLEVEFDH